MNKSMKMLHGQHKEGAEMIEALCASIVSDAVFAEHEHLLNAAISSLKTAKEVLNSTI